MTNEDLVKLGFKPLDHYTVQNSHIISLGRDRWLSVGLVGTPNEMVFVYEQKKNTKYISDLVVVHNYDFDGYLTISKLDQIYNVFTNKHLKIPIMNKIITFLGRLSYSILIALLIETLVSQGRALEIEKYTPIIWFIQLLVFICLVNIVINWEKE